MNTLLVTAAEVRAYLDNVSATTSDQYSEATIGSNILAAEWSLETATGRYFMPRTFTTGVPYTLTTQLRAQVPLPGFRSISQLSWGGSILTANEGYWLIPDAQQTGIYTGVQFRPYRVNGSGLPWWWGNQGWFDRNYDSPFYPANWGGGYNYTSSVNDLLIAGEAGYDPTLPNTTLGYPPFQLLHAIKVLAGFYTMRPASILADVAITPQGGVLNYSTMPAEVRDFIAGWKVGPMMVSVG